MLYYLLKNMLYPKPDGLAIICLKVIVYWDYTF
ncbi:hypothetical protein EZS27_002247 [termite gut metagenome]|uniref:Uncharacterized protein n=1 Tax=termite gut metagenome TaxID=433724 RepID=A0A5J4SXA4_9ZZZZ